MLLDTRLKTDLFEIVYTAPTVLEPGEKIIAYTKILAAAVPSFQYLLEPQRLESDHTGKRREFFRVRTVHHENPPYTFRPGIYELDRFQKFQLPGGAPVDVEYRPERLTVQDKELRVAAYLK